MIKKSISSLLVILSLISLMVLSSVSVSAETASGNAGDNIFWSINTDTGEMFITGSGDMNDRYTEWQYTPYSVKYRNYVTKASVQEGITSIGNNAFCCFEKLQEVSVPLTATKIGYYAFNNLFIIKAISVPSATFIDNHAFYNCYALTDIELGNSLSRINAYAFGNCSSLEHIYLPKSLTTIERYVFTGCSSLKDVYYQGSESDWNRISIDYGNDCLLNANIHYGINSDNGTTSSQNELKTGDTFLLGEYPQSEVIDNTIIASLNSSSTNWITYDYLDSDGQIIDSMKYKDVNYNGKKYRGVYFTEYRREGKQSENGYQKDHAYWFEYEPVEWILLNENTGLSICKNAIDSQPFHHTGSTINGIKANNYEKSDIRVWLTNQFVNDSFDSEETDCIIASTSVSDIPMNDYVFLLSKNEADGLSSNQKPTYSTDYANCQGASNNSDGHTQNWCTRTAAGDSYSIYYMQLKWGSYTVYYNWYDDTVWVTSLGVRPAVFVDVSKTAQLQKKYSHTELSFYNSSISSYVGNSNSALFILDSKEYDIGDISFESNDSSTVEIYTVSIGEGTYITKEDEKMATIYFDCKKTGSAIITATAPDGSTATLNVTVEKKPAIQKSIAILTTEKSLSVKTGDKMWLAFGLMDDATQKIDGQWKKMAITNSDPTIVSLSDYSETEYGYSLELTGLRQGASHLTITDTETGINTIITVSVYDQYVKSYSYAIDNVSAFYPNNNFEKHIATNIYDLNGLYVNNYSCTTTSSGYDVSFDVYNSRYYSGAVDIYDASGALIDYEEIEKFSDISSLWDAGVQVYYLISDPITKSLFTYQQASFSKRTHISISVPSGGSFTISNNIAETPSGAMLNSLEILFDTTCDFFDLAISGADKATAFEGFKASIKEQTLKEIREGKMEIALNTLKKETKDIMKKLIKSDLKNRISMSNEVYSDMSTLSESILSSYSINWKHFFKSATGVGESYFTKFAGPAGVALKGCFAITKGSNKLLRAIQMSASCDNTYATFYSNKNDCNINQHGVVVNTQGNVDAEAVLQVFKVSNDDTVVSAIDSSFDKYELYNISFVKNDQLVQPSGKVTVRIPIPQGMKGNTCKVYRKENNNEWTILDAHIEGNYLVFETDHFSLYTVVGDSESISIASLPTTLDYFSGQTLDTTGLVLSLNGEEITDGFICNPAVVSGTGTQTITVMYGNLVTEFEVNVNAPLLGDVDGDGEVTIIDATFIQRHLASLAIPFEMNEATADTDGDSEITIIDATFIQRYLASLAVPYDIGNPINK